MQTLISVFDDRQRARNAVDRLLAAGFAQVDLELRDEADGRLVMMVDTRSDAQTDMAALILHDEGAVEMDDRDSSGGTPLKPGVRLYNREARPTIDALARQRQLREESLLADRAGQVSKELKEDREERAYATAMTVTTRDRPK